ncbi:MAG: hypothetical protein KGN84_17260 [Acidobacteriota bacterium]|nr:hypothetical protein [Acidobacteriota bacterium]
MLLTGIFASFFALAIAVIAFGAVVKQNEPPRTPADPLQTREASHFFTSPQARPLEMPRVPVEALLSQLESHVRLEQAAAESFVADPTSALLHSRTASPFVN